MLDLNVLNVEILNLSKVFVQSPDYTTSSYKKATYRQFILWQEGRLGRGNYKVVPSCVIWTVRNRYPALDGLYLGLKNIEITQIMQEHTVIIILLKSH